MTLTHLAATLAAPHLAARGLKPASRLAIEALTARVLATAARAHAIPYFAPVSSAPGLGPAVAATLTELRLEAVDPDLLAASGAPGRDLATLLSACEEERERELIADLPVVYQLAVEALDDRTNEMPAVIGLPLLLVDLPLASRAQLELLSRVIARAPVVLALHTMGDESGLDRLAGLMNVRPETVSNAGRHLASALFVDRSLEPEVGIEFFSAAGEGLECVEIARKLRHLARTDSLAFDSAAILLRNPTRYQPLVEEALRRAGIPAWFSRGVARPDPGGRAFLALLACAREGCSASRFAEYLSLGQVPNPQEALTSGAAPLPPDDELLASLFAPASGDGSAVAFEQEPSTYVAAPMQWEKLLVDAAVVGGRARWERRLKGLENECRFQLASLERENSPLVEMVERRLDRLRDLSRFALPLIAQLDSLPSSALWGDWLEALSGLARAALKRPEPVWSVLDEMRAMESIGPVGLAEVYEALADRLRFLRRDQGQSRFGRVFVGSIAEARGRSFSVVFLPGLAEGLFPQRPLEDPILLDESRGLIRTDLETQPDRVAQERLLLHLAVGAARDRLVYSYPRMDVMQNRPRVPSFYALELLRAVRGKLPDLKLFEREAAEAAPTRLDWPAPRNPAEAIDDAEFDLSMLGHIMQMPVSDTKGAAHYLTGANQHLVRSLRSRGRRWRSGWFPADGLVSPSDLTRARLAQFRLTAKAYSPSSLQTYADCPYKFFLYAIWRLEPRLEPVPLDQMDPLTRGSLFHDVQRVLMEELQQRGMLPVTQVNIGDALTALDQRLDQLAGEYAENLAPAIDRVWATEVEELRTDLRGWLQLAALSGSEWLPERFEHEFREAVILEDGFRVRGKIDLIERHFQTGNWRITDYKTGLFPEPPPVRVAGGKTLQPLLYSLAARAELGGTVSGGRLSFCTRRGRYQDVEIPLNPAGEQALATVLCEIDTAIDSGFLPAAPASGACERCDYSTVCGPYEEERLRRKQRSKLAGLDEMRKLP